MEYTWKRQTTQVAGGVLDTLLQHSPGLSESPGHSVDVEYDVGEGMSVVRIVAAEVIVSVLCSGAPFTLTPKAGFDSIDDDS